MIKRFVSALGILFCILCDAGMAKTNDTLILIDLGHSAVHTGARSASGRKEYYFNSRMTAKIAACLKKRGYVNIVVMDAKQKNVRPAERAARANHLKPALLVSIHHDSVQPQYLQNSHTEPHTLKYCDLFRGYSIFYSEKNGCRQSSLQVATAIGESLRKSSFTPSYHHAEKIFGENRTLVDSLNGVYRFNELTILGSTIVPAVLVECGVIVNRSEEGQLLDEVYILKFATAIADGIVQANLSVYSDSSCH